MPGKAGLHALTASERSDVADAALGLILCFVAGAINAGGFLAVGQYTSHMSGIISAISDNVALGAFGLVSAGLAMLLSFIAGAACCAILVNWSRRRDVAAPYAPPLLFEGGLLIGFALLDSPAATLPTILLLTFIMGLQNAIITKVSDARIRTTHMTGIVTDIGIELGKLAFWNRAQDKPRVTADRKKLRLLSSLLSGFIIGGTLGAIGFKWIGSTAAVPLAAVLLVIGMPALKRDRQN